MEKVKKQISITQSAFRTDDGNEYAYEGLAREHEEKLYKEKLSRLRSKQVSLPDGTRAKFYYAENVGEFRLIASYLDFLDCDEDKLKPKAGWIGIYEDPGERKMICCTPEDVKTEWEEKVEAFSSQFAED